MKKYKYTAKNFNQFKISVKYWLNEFGITEWEIDYKHHQIDSAAQLTYNNKSKLACFSLTKKGKADFCFQDDLNRLALHEVIHLLLADFGYAIKESGDFDSDLAIAQEHAVVMRLMKALANRQSNDVFKKIKSD
jgi:hypothetical protein